MSSLRRIEVSDVYHLHSINTRCLPENYPIDFYLSMVIKYSDISYVIVNCGTPIGYVLLTLEPLSKINVGENPHEMYGYIASIAVMPEWRRNGVAQKLIGAAMAALRARGISSSCLHVRVDNIGAISLYKKLGYSVISVETEYYDDGTDAYLMQKIIT